jgi:hypothetical protein
MEWTWVTVGQPSMKIIGLGLVYCSSERVAKLMITVGDGLGMDQYGHGHTHGVVP